MFIVDDILTAPFRAVLWILRKVVDAAEEEQLAEEDRLKEALRELYMRLETGQISEAEFDAHERVLLDRLDEIAKNDEIAEDGDEEDEDEDDEEDDEEDDDDHG